MIRFSLVFAVFLLMQGCELEPDNYEDCVLENVDKARTAAAVSVVRHTCRKKFPKPTKRISTVEALGLDKDKWRAFEEDGVIRVIPIDPETGLADPFSEDAHILREMPED